MKTNIDEIIKNAKVKFKMIDYSTPKQKKQLRILKEQQEARQRSRKKISIGAITILY
ncbi:MAG TPA: hypothetical protein VF622_17925 [Segetibacter sp.]|jgi:hypothetical protein